MNFTEIWFPGNTGYFWELSNFFQNANWVSDNFWKRSYTALVLTLGSRLSISATTRQMCAVLVTPEALSTGYPVCESIVNRFSRSVNSNLYSNILGNFATTERPPAQSRRNKRSRLFQTKQTSSHRPTFECEQYLNTSLTLFLFFIRDIVKSTQISHWMISKPKSFRTFRSGRFLWPDAPPGQGCEGPFYNSLIEGFIAFEFYLDFKKSLI